MECEWSFVVWFELLVIMIDCLFIFFFQAEDGIRDYKVTGVQTCALPISSSRLERNASHRPSGLQRGVFSPAFEVVRRTFRVPSQFVIQTALLFRSSAVSGVETVYATQAPSGEISGSRTSRTCSTSSSENGRGGAERETAVGACAPSAGANTSPARVGMTFRIMREANPGLALRARVNIFT